MVRNHFAPAIWGHFRQPFLVGIGQPLFKILLTLLEIRLVARIERAELGRDSLGDAAAVIRIKPVVRIAHGMDITFSASHAALGNLKNLRELRRVKIALSAGLYLAIATLRDQRRKPANFQFKADENQ